MKNLDKTKAYDLRDLNDEQLEVLLCWLRINDTDWRHISKEDLHNATLFYSDLADGWDFEYDYDKTTNNALELFELQIGDTFEYNGYICEVKEPIKRWVYDTYQEVYYKTSKIDQQTITITNQQLIKLLEENEIH